MNIVFLAPFGIRPKGALQARMLPLAKELQRIGHQLEIIAPPYTNPEDSGLVEEVEGVTLRNVRLGPVGGAVAAPFIALRMLRASLDQKPDLIHLFKPKGYGGLAAMALAGMGLAGVKTPLLVVDSDDREGSGGMNDLHPYSWPEKRLFSLQEQWLTRWADGVTVASLALESLAWGMGAQPETTLYLPNGPVLRPVGSREQGRLRFGFQAEQPVLLLYTRFFEFDQQRLYAVLEQLCKRMPELGLLVVGKGQHGEEKALEQAAAERVGQIAEYLQLGESGLLVESGDVDGLIQAAQLLLTDRAAAQRIGQAAGQRMAALFGWEKRAEELDQFYQRLVTLC